MAYVFKLPQTVTEEIMRYVIGYPCDRIRAMVAGLRREDTHHFFPGTNTLQYFVDWDHMLDHGLHMEFYTPPCFSHSLTELDKKRSLRLLQEQCEPCEPTELELQHMYFKSF